MREQSTIQRRLSAIIIVLAATMVDMPCRLRCRQMLSFFTIIVSTDPFNASGCCMAFNYFLQHPYSLAKNLLNIRVGCINKRCPQQLVKTSHFHSFTYFCRRSIFHLLLSHSFFFICSKKRQSSYNFYCQYSSRLRISLYAVIA